MSDNWELSEVRVKSRPPTKAQAEYRSFMAMLKPRKPKHSLSQQALLRCANDLRARGYSEDIIDLRLHQHRQDMSLQNAAFNNAYNFGINDAHSD